MFNIVLDYPNYEEELQVVKTTTTDSTVSIQKIMDAREIIAFQHLIRRNAYCRQCSGIRCKISCFYTPKYSKGCNNRKQFVAWGAGHGHRKH